MSLRPLGWQSVMDGRARCSLVFFPREREHLFLNVIGFGGPWIYLAPRAPPGTAGRIELVLYSLLATNANTGHYASIFRPAPLWRNDLSVDSEKDDSSKSPFWPQRDGDGTMLHLISNMGVLNMLLLFLAVLSALVLGWSAMRYVRHPVTTLSYGSPILAGNANVPPLGPGALMLQIVFSNPKDEINFEDDDSIYAFYGGAKRLRSGSKSRRR